MAFGFAPRRPGAGAQNALKARILGTGALGILIGALLAAAKHRVIFAAPATEGQRLRRRELRAILPGGWLRTGEFRVQSEESRGRDELLIVALPRARLSEMAARSRQREAPLLVAGGPSLFFNCDPEDRDVLAPPAALGLCLATLLQLEPVEVEVPARKGWFVLPRTGVPRELVGVLQEAGLSVLESQEVEPCARSLFLLELLELPAALCHGTLGQMLSYPQGREICAGVLEEGLQSFARLGRAVGRLPELDPQELLQRLRSRGAELDGARLSPDRAYGALLQSILRGERPRRAMPNERLIRLASEAGVSPWWNWRLARKLGRIGSAGFYRDPVELYEAVR
jgi:ketopantoate reductase